MRRFIISLIFIITILVIKTTNLINVSVEIKITLFIVAPIYILWLILRYSKPGKVLKYRKIAICCVISVFYSIAASEFLNKNYPAVFEKYKSLLMIFILGSLFITILVGGVCVYLIKLNEDDYKGLL